MKHSKIILLSSTILITTFSFAKDLKTETQETNYMIGADVGKYIKKSGVSFNLDSFIAGINDAMAEKKLLLSNDQITSLRKALQDKQQKIQAMQYKAKAAKLEADKILNLEAGKEFITKKSQQANVQSTSSGLLYEVLKQGSGAKPASDSAVVTVHYQGKLIDGSTFENSKDSGKPSTFSLNQVIKGWTEGLQLMSTGSTFRFYIPSKLAYGVSTRPGSPIGPNSTLIFDIELLKVKQATK